MAAGKAAASARKRGPAGGEGAGGGSAGAGPSAATNESERGAPHLVAGELHPFRHPPESWPALVAAVASLGVTHVTTLVPWSEHEPSAGEWDFGTRRAALAVGSFLDLVEAAGLRAVVRVGPRVRADLSLAGIPEHVVFDRASMARSARGNPVPSPMPVRIFPWPSYSSVVYRERVTAWLAAVLEVLAPRLAPRGIVDALDVEDAGAVLLRAGAYARDYHPDATRGFREFLAASYGSPAALSAAWGVRVARFDDVSAPTRFSAQIPRDLPRHLDWVAFQESTVASFRAFLCETLRGREGGAPEWAVSSTLDANALGTPNDAGGAGRTLDRVGVELSVRADELAAARRRVTPVALASARPFVRVVIGGSPWGRARTDADSLAALLLGVAFGAREFELSMAVDHERWWGAPLAADGAPNGNFESTRRLVRALGTLELERRVDAPEVLIVVPPEYTRITRVTHLFGPIGAGILDFVGRSFAEATLEGAFGFERPIQHAVFERLRELESALDANHVAFAFADPTSATNASVAPKLVCVPSFDFVDADTTRALERLADGGARILAGPLVPHLDGRMDPSEFPAHVATWSSATDAASAGSELDPILSALGIERLPHDPASRARAYPITRAHGVVAYVLANPGGTSGELAFDVDLICPLTETVLTAGTRIAIAPDSLRLVVLAAPPAPPASSRRRASSVPAANPSKPARVRARSIVPRPG